ncbi:MAG: hypothetical protein AABX23_00055 [Nanoarchaeota archaeon]
MENQQITLEEMHKILLYLKAKMQKMDHYIEDLEFARLTQEAWQEIETGKYTKYNSSEDFLATLKEKYA